MFSKITQNTSKMNGGLTCSDADAVTPKSRNTGLVMKVTWNAREGFVSTVLARSATGLGLVVVTLEKIRVSW